MFFHNFHMVERSPWPLLSSFSILNFVMILLIMFHEKNKLYFFIILCLIGLFLNMYLWWRDIVREACFQGCHTFLVHKSMKFGMILFILSEVMFFFSFFWAYFHMMLSPDIELGLIWPPKGILIFNPYNIPFLNTMILLSSGVTVTWSHHSMLNMKYKNCFWSLMMTIMLGIYFTMLQGFEYYSSMYSLNDSVYGSIFFVATGFHGLHVIIGTLFLFINFLRLMKGHFSKTHHFSFEASIWYWHFVDVVWMFLYIFVYWWVY